MALTRQKAAIQMETIWTAIDLFKFNNYHAPSPDAWDRMGADVCILHVQLYRQSFSGWKWRIQKRIWEETQPPVYTQGWVPGWVPPIPAPAGYRNRDTLSAVLRGVTASPAPLPRRVTDHERWRRGQRVGRFSRGRQATCTVSILHYLWLCTSCWDPDDGVHVWPFFFLYLAFRRRHEMKCKAFFAVCWFFNSCGKSTMSPPLPHPTPTQPQIWLHITLSMPRASASNPHITCATHSAVFH